MQKEFDAVSSLLGGEEGTLHGNRVKLALSGIGKVNAAVCAARLIDGFRPDCIVSSGCAGGLASGLRLLDVIVSTETVYHDVSCGPEFEYGRMQGFPPRFASDPRLLKAAEGLDSEGRIHYGLTCSGDRFVSTPEEARDILSHFPEALAADMESGALAQVCFLHGIPFISLRVISDTVLAEDRLNQYYDFWGKVAGTSFKTLGLYLEKLNSVRF